MKRTKKGTEQYLLDKRRYYAKKLSLSDDYAKDKDAYDEIVKARTALEEQGGLSEEDGKRLVEIIAKQLDCADSILKKYKLQTALPPPLEFLEKAASGEDEVKSFHPMELFPVRMLSPSMPGPTGTEKCKTLVTGDTWVSLSSREKFSIEINPRGNKNDILHHVSKLLDVCAAHGIKGDKRFRNDSVFLLEEGEKIYYAMKAGKNPLQIAKKRCGIDANPAYDDTVKAEDAWVRRRLGEIKKVKGEQ